MTPKSPRPSIDEAPLELPAPSGMPHMSTEGIIKPGELEYWDRLWRIASAIRSVLPRRRGAAPTENDA